LSHQVKGAALAAPDDETTRAARIRAAGHYIFLAFFFDFFAMTSSSDPIGVLSCRELRNDGDRIGSIGRVFADALVSTRKLWWCNPVPKKTVDISDT